jgi:protoporphyrinogen/coproporphyrinogen III oxidase
VDVGVLDYASIGLVTYVLSPGALDASPLAGKSGALIPAVEGHIAKAITVFSSKWAAQPDGAVLLRASVGRYGEERSLAYDDESLIGLVHQDLAKIVGVPLTPPLAARVFRWGGALPQYLPGHLDRMARARAGLPETVALAGAAFDGVGIPACVASGERAADRIISAVGRMG